MLAKEVGQLCPICDDLPKVVEKLRIVIGRRISEGKMMGKSIKTIDVVNVRKELVAEKGPAGGSAVSNKKQQQSSKGYSCKDDDVLEMVFRFELWGRVDGCADGI
jgi:hypothetical protein